MIRDAGYKKTPKKEEEAPKKDSLLRKAFNKIDDFGKLRAAKWLAATALATAVLWPIFDAAGTARNESPHPSLADEETWYIFFDKAGDNYGTIFNIAAAPFKLISDGVYYLSNDNDQAGEPKHFIICKPLDSLRDGHYQYYKDLDRKLQETLANQANNKQIQDMLDNGYTPIIKYTTPFMKNAGDLMLSHAPIEYRTAKNPTCGSNIYRAETVKIVR